LSGKSIKTDKDIKVLFVHASDASFIDVDRTLLKKNFDVTSLRYSGKRGILKLLRGMLRCHVGFAWFEHDHAFFTVLFSKMFRKKSVVVAAGAMTLAADWEKLKPSFKSKFVAKFSTKRAHRVFAVSQYKKDRILEYVKTDNIRVVYHGFDSEYYKPADAKEDMIITIGEVDEVNFWRKGFNTFVQAAESFPEVQFVIIGKHADSSIEKLRKMAPKNVKFTGWISDDELIRYMQRAKVYAQLSTYESFGCAVAEAMLCECVPVVTDRGSLPEVVGDVGFKIEYGNVKETIQAFRKALSSDRHKEARKRVIEKFPMDDREKLIVTNIREILGKGD
jgi:glycosyltransferase involved in cell wall biosynthesis